MAVLTRERRLAGLGATAFVHALLALAWLAARTLPPAAQPDGPRMQVQWLTLPALPARTARPEIAAPAPAPAPARPASARAPRAPAVPVVAAPPLRAAPAASTATPAPAQPAPSAPAPPAESSILERARRDAGAIDRALRKENQPLIVAPPDSPQIRLQKGIEHAAEMAPNAWYQAPKMTELVNPNGDGARRERIITGNKTYCITERAPTTNVEMIEMHGKVRITTCPEHEAPAQAQEWRTARDAY